MRLDFRAKLLMKMFAFCDRKLLTEEVREEAGLGNEDDIPVVEDYKSRSKLAWEANYACFTVCYLFARSLIIKMLRFSRASRIDPMFVSRLFGQALWGCPIAK